VYWRVAPVSFEEVGRSLLVARRAGRNGALRRSSRLSTGSISACCASHRREWRVASVTKDSALEGSDFCSSRGFMWRVAHLHLFITGVAQEAWRGAQARNLYKKKSFSDPGLAFWKLSYTIVILHHLKTEDFVQFTSRS
ncbi:hypothetical protein A2U01_0043778, partial [Trifolium medium]|nr:hypothetical protein [Trifolium medium]